MATAMLVVELDVIPDDFPWKELETGKIVNDLSCGVCDIEGRECEAWNLSHDSDEDITVNLAVERALEIVGDLERIGKFRMADDDWQVLIPQSTFLRTTKRR